MMGLETEAVYEDGVFKLERLLPLKNGAKVRLTVHPPGRGVRRSYGLMQWQGSQQELERLALDPEYGIEQCFKISR